MDRTELDRPSLVETGFRRLTYPHQEFLFVAEVTRMLVEKGIVNNAVSLEELHKHIPPKDQVVNAHYMNNVVDQFYETSTRFRELYFGLIKYIHREYFQYDFIFQAIPNFRFHFPVHFGEAFRNKRNKDGVFLGQHSDTMLGHSFEEVNFWLPLTECRASNALHMSDLASGIQVIGRVFDDIGWDSDVYHTAGREHFHKRLFSDDDFQSLVVRSTKPVDMKVGEFIAFDPRCLHGPAENTEGRTRVSLDFRIIPLHRYEHAKHYRSQGKSKRKFVRGDVFFQVSASELE